MAVLETKTSPTFRAYNVLAIALVCLAYTFFFQMYPNFVNPNENSRLLLASALVDDHTSQIDQAMQRYGDTQDKSIYAGHFYAAKVPGYSYLIAPFYFILTRIAPVQDTLTIIWLLRFFVNLIPLLFFAIFFRRYLDQKIGIGAKSYFVIAAFLVGTLYYPYAQLLMSHATTGIVWMLGFYFLTEYTEPKYGFVGGAFLGAGFVMEALSFIPIALCGLYLLVRKRRMLILYAVGAGLFSLPSFVYNAYYFGGPLNWPYEHTYDPQFQLQTSTGYVGIHLPSLRILWKLAFGDYRGMFYYTPHLIFGLAGLVCEKRNRSEALTALGIVAGNFILISGRNPWDGGWSFGPRFLLPTIPFLVYGSALWLRQLDAWKENPRLKTMSGVLFYAYLIAVAFTIPPILFGTVTFPFPPQILRNPLILVNFTLFWRGFFGPNLGALLGFNDFWIRTVSMIFVIFPAIFFAYRSKMGRRAVLTFAIALILAFSACALLQKPLQDRISAQHCFAIGRTGFLQANYLKALEFLRYSNERNPPPILKKETDRYINLTTTKLKNGQ